VLVVIALVVSTEGLPLDYEVMLRSILDTQPLRLFVSSSRRLVVDKINQRHGKARRVWLMGQGIATERTLESLRPRRSIIWWGRLTRHQAELAQQPWSPM